MSIAPIAGVEAAEYLPAAPITLNTPMQQAINAEMNSDDWGISDAAQEIAMSTIQQMDSSASNGQGFHENPNHPNEALEQWQQQLQKELA